MLTAIWRWNPLLAQISDALPHNPLTSAPSVYRVIKSWLLSWRTLSNPMRTTLFLCTLGGKTTAHITKSTPHWSSRDSGDIVFLGCNSPFARLEPGSVSPLAVFLSQAQRHKTKKILVLAHHSNLSISPAKVTTLVKYSLAANLIFVHCK